MKHRTVDDIAHEEKRLSNCVGKIKLATKKVATKAARRRKNRTAYMCDHCHYWHVGSVFKKREKPMKAV